jgi:hypothetical protein
MTDTCDPRDHPDTSLVELDERLCLLDEMVTDLGLPMAMHARIADVRGIIPRVAEARLARMMKESSNADT